jgi:hypothetical protein
MGNIQVFLIFLFLKKYLKQQYFWFLFDCHDGRAFQLSQQYFTVKKKAYLKELHRKQTFKVAKLFVRILTV